MKFLLFLLLGTLLFGIAFPAMIAFIGLAGIVVLALIFYRLMRGGSGFTVYTSRDFRGESGGSEERRRIYTEEEPEVTNVRRERYGDSINVAADDDEMEEASEVIELPATALRKDDDGEKREL
ncbi:MAG: hypothetical protein Q4D58_00595 [Synergistaceae bacterium]|nr:hypothetical protein [Synergistaceae bacterium]